MLVDCLLTGEHETEVMSRFSVLNSVCVCTRSS